MATIIQLRNDTAANWTSANPVLAIGEAGIETDTNKIKIGNGITRWSGLNYFGGAVESVNGQTGVVVLDAEDVGALPDTTVIPVTDVQINSISILSGGVANIPIADNNTLGLVIVKNGLQITNQGNLNTQPANEAQLIAQSHNYNPVVPAKLSIAIREGLGNNSLTWSDAYKVSACKTIGTISGVQINGTDLAPDTTTNKVNIPIAANGVLGVVKPVGNGIIVDGNGSISLQRATDNELVQQTNMYKPVVSGNLSKAVMEGLGNNSLTWTDTYKASARNTIGAEKETTIQMLSATDSITLADNTIYNGGEITSLNIALPSTATLGFLCEIDFSSGATASTLSYPNTIKWLGDDLENGVFVPQASKRYMVVISYDGNEYVAIVKGIE